MEAGGVQVLHRPRELEAKIRVVSLYLNPPEKAVVVCTGKVTDACYQRHTHAGFLDLPKVVAKA